MAGTFEYWQSRQDYQFWFHLKEEGNHEIIIASTEGYTTEEGCLKGIASTKRNAPGENNYKNFQGTDEKFYFTLKAGNYEPVARSQGYNTQSGRDRGKENCKIEAPKAVVRRVNK